MLINFRGLEKLGFDVITVDNGIMIEPKNPRILESMGFMVEEAGLTESQASELYSIVHKFQTWNAIETAETMQEPGAYHTAKEKVRKAKKLMDEVESY